MSDTISVFRGVACAALAATVVLAAGSARADCRLSIQPGQDQWLINYDPFDQDDVSRSFDIALVNQGDTVCSGMLSVGLRGEQFGLRQGGDAQRVLYALVDESGGTDITPRAGQSGRRLNARPVSLAPGERSLVRFSFAASPDDLISAGLYSQDAFISVETPDGLPLAERGVTLAVNVIPAAVMGLKGAFRRHGGVATIDLGELERGSRSLDTSLFVDSTAGYRVSVTSKNRGELRHSEGEWAIAYDLGIGNHNMTLANPGDITVSSKSARSDSYPLSVTIDAVADKRAGDYSDTLTFTVAAL